MLWRSQYCALLPVGHLVDDQQSHGLVAGVAAGMPAPDELHDDVSLSIGELASVLGVRDSQAPGEDVGVAREGMLVDGQHRILWNDIGRGYQAHRPGRKHQRLT